jgi:hypothetical protein
MLQLFEIFEPSRDAELPQWITGGCRRQVDGRAGLPSVPEMPSAPQQLRLVPQAEVREGQ